MAFVSVLAHTAETPATTSEATKARIRATPRSDSRQRGTGTAGSISTSGWVTKIRAMARR